MAIGGIQIGTRKKDPRLKELFDSGKKVYSFSKLSSIENCPYGAYLNYVLHQKNKKQSVWGILGGKFHDKLEEITLGEATPDELKPLVAQELENLDIIGIDFPKDSKGGDSIRRNWITDMEHFSNHFEPLKGTYDTEKLLILKIDEDHYLQGYADLIRHNEDGTCSILDWKSSSLYDTKGFEHAAHQLRIYGLAMQQEGIRVRDLSWIFMKYVEVEFMGKARANSKKESLRRKIIERRKIGQEMSELVESDLYSLGYEEMDVDSYLYEMQKNNSLDGLPAEVRNKYKFRTYIKTIPFEGDEDGISATLDYIADMIRNFEERNEKDEEAWEHRNFTITTKFGKVREDTFYCNALCDFGETCKYIKAFNDSKTQENDEMDEWF